MFSVRYTYSSYTTITLARKAAVPFIIAPLYLNTILKHLDLLLPIHTPNIFGGHCLGTRLIEAVATDGPIGVGIELFQFIKPKTYVPDKTFDYARTGIFHICIIAADIETTAAQIEANGGKLMSKIWRLFSNKDYKGCYCWDPWGTVIELNSHSYLQTWSSLEEPHKL